MKKIEKFRPTWKAASVGSINFAALAELGIKYAIVDFDGTLVPTLGTKIREDSIQNLLLARSKSWLFDVCILSNCWLSCMAKRVKVIARAAGFKACPCWWPYPSKPHKPAFERAMTLMSGATPDNTVVIGDQVGTDILGANLAGIRSIWVPPIEPIPWWKRITLEVINQRRLRALEATKQIPAAPTRGRV